MLSNFTGGGQIFLHNVRMFVQVLQRSSMTAFFVSIAIVTAVSYKSALKLDLIAAATYQKALFVRGTDNAMSSIRSAVNPKNKYHSNRIDAYDSNGLYAKDVLPEKVIKSRHFQKAYEEVITFVKVRSAMILAVMASVFVIIYIVWSKFGESAKEKKHLSGSTIKTPKEVASYLKRSGKASYLWLGNMPLVKNSEPKHILITGSTGSGKTNCLHNLLPQIRKAGQPAIIVDTEGDMVSRYYRPGYDIIINPFDARTHNWDLWEEIPDELSIKKIANSFFPDLPPEIHEYDKKWTEWGRMLFIGCLEYLINEDAGNSNNKRKATIENLYNLIHKENIDDLTAKLENTSVGSILHSKSDNNVAPHNIRINTILATEWLEYISDEQDKSFSFRKWFKELDGKHDGKLNGNLDDRWIFISSSAQDSKILLPFFSVIIDIALNALISTGIKEDRRIWFVFDELAKLKYLPTLRENITILRKYGGCILPATQSFNQLLAHYGKNSGSVMLGQFNTNVIFRISEVEEAKIITKRIGEIEYLVHQKNTSYGAHEFRDGISYTEQEKRQDLVKVSDLASLKEHEAYVLLPEPEVAISKVTLNYVPKPKTYSLQASFIPNPKVHEMLIKRKNNWQKQINTNQQKRAKQNKQKQDQLQVTAKNTSMVKSTVKSKVAQVNEL